MDIAASDSFGRELRYGVIMGDDLADRRPHLGLVETKQDMGSRRAAIDCLLAE